MSEKIKIVGELAKFATEQSKVCGQEHEIVELRSGRCMRHTSAEFTQLVQKNAARIAACGNGHHIALVGEKTFGWCVAYLAAAMTKNVTVLTDPALPASYLQKLFRKADVDAVIYDSTAIEKIQTMAEQGYAFKFKMGMADFEKGSPIADGCDADIFEKPVEADVCSIFFTSGTSGEPKAVMLTHRNLISNTAIIGEDCQFRWYNATMFSMLPFYHAYGCVVELLIPLYLHCNLYLNDTITHLTEHLALVHPTHIACVPIIVKMLRLWIASTARKKNISEKEAMQLVTGGNLRQIICGGAHLPPDYIDIFSEMGVTVRVGYGMTECAPQIATNAIADVKKYSVGKIIRGEQIRIENNEIWIKGPNVMKGYYKDDKANAEAFSPDGWFKTGDLGYVDSDGFLYLTGRKKNLIIMDNGVNISPEHYENSLMACDAVEEVIVFSQNNQLTAEIYPAPVFDSATALAMIEKCIRELNLTLPPSRLLCRHIIREMPFPKTATNKILRDR